MSRFHLPAALLFVFAFVSTVSAQGTTDNSGSEAFDSSASDEIFSGVERSETVGSTGETGAGFSGLSAATGQGTTGGRTTTGGSGSFGGGFGGLGSLFGGMNTGGQAAKPVIRTRLRSAVAVAPLAPDFVQQVATDRFRQLAGKASLHAIKVKMDGRTAILSGVVASERDRRMSQLLVQLEPGVRKVENRIVVSAK